MHLLIEAILFNRSKADWIPVDIYAKLKKKIATLCNELGFLIRIFEASENKYSCYISSCSRK